ncbi:MAG: SDR family oxidoreductase [Alphaproteobacteria bacterium]|nr:SDR family oxidoreductase [Alphaproteobacteria bacterium]
MSAALAGRVALVSGGAQGLGAAIVRALHQAGASVTIADPGTDGRGMGADPGLAQGLARTLGSRALAYPESIASPSTAAAAVDLTVRRLGGLDIVVNAAAIRREASVLATDPGDWEAVLRVNLFATYYVLAAATAALRSRGRIVNLVRIADGPARGAQAVAAAGVLTLTRDTARDLAPLGASCNALIAGEAESPEAIATAALFLASDGAAAISGMAIGPSGGKLVRFGDDFRPGPRLDLPPAR